MTILKTVLACVGATILSFNAMATTPKGETKDAKTTDAVATPTETKTADAVAYFQYDGPQPATTAELNDEDNYNDIQVNPLSVCPSPGTNGCAARFTVSGTTHSGAPADIHTKP